SIEGGARGTTPASDRGLCRPPAVLPSCLWRFETPCLHPPPRLSRPSARKELCRVRVRVDALDAYGVGPGQLNEALDHRHYSVDRLLAPLVGRAGLPALDDLRELAGVGQRVELLVEDRLPEGIVRRRLEHDLERVLQRGDERGL